MDQSASISANNTIQKVQILNRKCKQHPLFSLEFLHLKGDIDNMFICSQCVKSQDINIQDIQNLKEILSADKTTVLMAFPPVKDQDILFQFNLMDPTKGFEQIDNIFKKFREQIQTALDQDQKKVKIQYIKYSKEHKKAVEEYQKIAEIDKLQQLINSPNEQDLVILKEFLKNKQNTIQENTKALSILLNATYQDIGKLQFIEPTKILEEIVEKLHQIDFIEGSVSMLSQASLIKSTLMESPLLETRSDSITNILEVTQTAPAKTWNQIFLDPILDPKKKYVIHIELESKNILFPNEFFFGIAPDSSKNTKQAFSFNMCYYASNSQQGITKQIKGSMWTRGTGINRFEVRINLNSRYLSVGSVPEYSSVVELDDPNKINQQVAYRLFLALLFPLDTIRITKLDTVVQFNSNFA